MITEWQRNEYRKALQRGGVPRVYAYMASRYLDASFWEWSRVADARYLLIAGFFWPETTEGIEFWRAVTAELTQ